MPWIYESIRASSPPLVNWEVIKNIVTSVKRIVDSTILKQCSSKECLLSYSIVDLVRIYTYRSGDDANKYMSKHLDTMGEERGKSQAAENLCRKQLEGYCKMKNQIKYNLMNVIVSQLNITASTKYHYWFAIFLNPRYAMEITDIKTFHHSKIWTPKKLSRR